MQSGQYDGISASGDATDPPDPAAASWRRSTRRSLPNYANVFEGLKNLPHNTVDGVNYGVPHGRGANLLDVQHRGRSRRRPTTWDGIWEDAADYKGKISIYDSSIFIADAALHLMDQAARPRHHRPLPADPGPVRRGHRAARAAARPRRPARTGRSTRDQMPSYAAGDIVIGTTWPFQVDLLQADGVPVEGVLPEEGSTGWSDTWMMCQERRASELHAHVDEPHDVGRGECPGHGVVR